MDLETPTDQNENVIDYMGDQNLTSAELDRQLEIENIFRNNLSQQLIDEYRRYAAEQHPNDALKRKQLIEQMQEDYYKYYLENVQQSLMYHQREQLTFLEHMKRTAADNLDSMEIKIMPLVPARMWTRPDIATFKKEILSTSKECCVKIGSLATATVSVPTHIDGTNVWWEFATDSYDLGFGLFFEWNANPSDQILVTVNESEDELEDEEDEYGTGEDDDEDDSQDEESDRNAVPTDTGNLIGNPNDPELAYKPKKTSNRVDPEVGKKSRRNRRKSSGGLPTDELIPVIRHDCHLQVYCGQHQYPGQGRYLFKFDNSFSILRSKWLYYRIYYSKE